MLPAMTPGPLVALISLALTLVVSGAPWSDAPPAEAQRPAVSRSGVARRRGLPYRGASQLERRARRFRARDPAGSGPRRRPHAPDREPHYRRRSRVDRVRLPGARVSAPPVHRGSRRAPRAVPEGDRAAALVDHLRPVHGRPHHRRVPGATAGFLPGRSFGMRARRRHRDRRLPDGVHRRGRADLRVCPSSMRPTGKRLDRSSKASYGRSACRARTPRAGDSSTASSNS